MAKKKQYTSVSSLLRDIVPDEELHAAFDELVAQRKLMKRLLAFRALRGMSQEDIAAKMTCTQSRISKLENARDDDTRLGDLRAYADAIGCELITCPLPRDMMPVEKVKCHTFAIKKHMDDLARLAEKDERIAEGIAGFFYELFINFIRMLGASAKRLPPRPSGTPYFDICISSFEGTVDEDDRPCCLEAEGTPEVAH